MSGRATRFGTGFSWGNSEPRKTWFPNTPTTSNDPRISAKLKRCDNHMASCRVRDRVNFQNSKGTIFGRWNADDHGHLRYVVYSYGEHYPLLVWDETIQHWFSVAYEDASSASVCTAGHLRRVGVSTATEVTEESIKLLAGIGLRDYVRTVIVAPWHQGKLASDVDLDAETDRQLADPLLPAILRKPGGLTDMDEGVGSELRRDAELAFETLTNMGVSLVMLMYYGGAGTMQTIAEAGEHPYSKTRGLVRLDAPCNGHRMVLHDVSFTPKPGSKCGRHVVKFTHENGEAVCFIECDSAKHARELAHTLRTMRRMNGIEDPVNPERKD